MEFKKPPQPNLHKDDKGTPENKIKEGVDFVFEQNPELANVAYETLGFRGVWKNTNTVFEENKFKNKDGETLTIKITTNGDNINLLIEDSNNHFKAKGSFVKNTDNTYSAGPEMIYVSEKSKGVGRAMYDYITNNFGNVKMQPNLLEGGKEFWDKNINITLEQKEKAQELYSKYLDTIFPDSKVKDIVYHRTGEKFDVFDKSKINKTNANRFYFSPFNTGRYGEYVIQAILNIKNLAMPSNDEFINDLNKRHPEYTKGKSQWFHLPSHIYVNADKYGYDGVFEYEGTNDDEYSVYHPEQIHILGSKQDIQNFKEFVSKNKEK
ncbi:MAG: hypothetical protein WC662_02425 [Candidatus Paceibacterota bacterium]|jgi:hypothetical protein